MVKTRQRKHTTRKDALIGTLIDRRLGTVANVIPSVPCVPCIPCASKKPSRSRR